MRAFKISKLITNRQYETIDKYLNEISKIPLINQEEEFKLARRIKEGDTLAYEKLVRANLRFVVSVAKQFQHSGIPLGDLICEGNIGLLKAAQKFDESKGFKFISYAVWWIRQSIMLSISEKSRIVRMPQSKLSILKKIQKTSSLLEQQYEREPSLEEMSTTLNIPEDEILNLLKMGYKQTSIDAPLGSETDYSLLDILEDNSTFKPDSILNQHSLKEDLRRTVLKLPKQMVTVITLYYGLNSIEPMTLDEIGRELNLSGERIRQIKQIALRKLMRSPAKNTIKNYI